MKNIHKLLMLFVALGFIITANAQVDRTKAPAAGPAPKVQLGDYDSFTLKNGLKVLIVENDKLPRVQYALLFLNEPVVEGNKSGYTSIAGDLLNKGTKNRTEEQFSEEVDFMGASVNASEGGVFANGLSKYKDKIMEIMADITMNPVFPKAEFDKIVKQTLSGLESDKTSPRSIARNLRSKVLYGKNHPYGDVTTETTIKNITLEDCKQYYKTYFVPNNAIMVIVGDIKTKDAKKMVEKYFGKWKQGVVPSPKYQFPNKIKGKRVVFSNRDAAPQSLVQIINVIDLKPGSPDVIPAKVMNAMLGRGFMGLLNKNLREDKAYTYGANSGISTDRLVAKFYTTADVKANVTDSSLMEMAKEMKTMRDEKLTQDHLDMVKATMAGDFARALESPSTIANYAFSIVRNNLPKDYYATYLQKLDKVTLADVKAMANKYIDPNNAVYLIVGDRQYKNRLAKLSSSGKVEEYDYKGDVVKNTAALPAGLTAQAVIDKYIDATGGKAKWQSIKTIVMKANMEMGPMTANIERYNKGDKFAMKIMANGQVMQAMSYNGKVAKVSQMGQSQEITDPEGINEIKDEGIICEELTFNERGFKIELTGTADIDGEQTYKIKVISKDGNVSYDYYSIKSGLKVKTSAQEEGMAVDVRYSNYKTVEGLTFPFEITTIMGPQKMPMKVSSIEINKEIKNSVFE